MTSEITKLDALPAELAAKLAALTPNLADIGLSAGEARQLLAPTFKVPAGGLEFFEVPEQLVATLGKTAESVTGVFAGYRRVRIMWPPKSDSSSDPDEKERPLCQSVDGVTGCGEFTSWEDLACEDCPMQDWTGTKDKPVKPRCSSRGVMTLLVDGYDGPVFVDAAPASAKNARQFAAMNFQTMCRRKVTVTIRKEKGPEGPFGVMVFTAGDVVADVERVMKALEATERGNELLNTKPSRPSVDAEPEGDLVDYIDAEPEGDLVDYIDAEVIHGDAEDFPEYCGDDTFFEDEETF